MVAKTNAQLSEFYHKHERSFPEKHERNRQDNADDVTGSEGKIEGEAIPLNVHVSVKSTDPWDLMLYHKDWPHKDENRPNDEQHLC
jgi:hypothetical protein